MMSGPPIAADAIVTAEAVDDVLTAEPDDDVGASCSLDPFIGSRPHDRGVTDETGWGRRTRGRDDLQDAAFAHARTINLVVGTSDAA
jgi:hypothetical protein